MQIKIIDNGNGTPKAYHEKIFDMFFRASAQVSGSGLGLYIVKETLDKLHGTINVISEETMGTTFRITLKNMLP